MSTTELWGNYKSCGEHLLMAFEVSHNRLRRQETITSKTEVTATTIKSWTDPGEDYLCAAALSDRCLQQLLCSFR